MKSFTNRLLTITVACITMLSLGARSGFGGGGGNYHGGGTSYHTGGSSYRAGGSGYLSTTKNYAGTKKQFTGKTSGSKQVTGKKYTGTSQIGKTYTGSKISKVGKTSTGKSKITKGAAQAGQKQSKQFTKKSWQTKGAAGKGAGLKAEPIGHVNKHGNGHGGGHGGGHDGHNGNWQHNCPGCCATCSNICSWCSFPMSYDFGWAGWWFPWLIATPLIYGAVNSGPDVIVTQQVNTTGQEQATQQEKPIYEFDLAIHQNQQGDVLTEQILTPDKKTFVYIHDPEQPNRIIEKHELDPNGKEQKDPVKNKKGTIKRMKINAPTRITTYTVDNDNEVINTQVSYAEKA